MKSREENRSRQPASKLLDEVSALRLEADEAVVSAHSQEESATLPSMSHQDIDALRAYPRQSSLERIRINGDLTAEKYFDAADIRSVLLSQRDFDDYDWTDAAIDKIEPDTPHSLWDRNIRAVCNSGGRHVIQQQATRTCYHAVCGMLILDRLKAEGLFECRPDLKWISTGGRVRENSVWPWVERELSRVGLVMPERVLSYPVGKRCEGRFLNSDALILKALEDLQQILFEKGSVLITGRGHVFALDDVRVPDGDLDRATVQLRDPWHGWEIVVDGRAFLKDMLVQDAFDKSGVPRDKDFLQQKLSFASLDSLAEGRRLSTGELLQLGDPLRLSGKKVRLSRRGKCAQNLCPGDVLVLRPERTRGLLRFQRPFQRARLAKVIATAPYEKPSRSFTSLYMPGGSDPFIAQDNHWLRTHLRHLYRTSS